MRGKSLERRCRPPLLPKDSLGVTARAELTTWRKLQVVGDPRSTTFVGATLMPIANGDLADPRNSAEDCSCSDSLASQVSCPARLSRSVPAYFRLHRNKSPRPMADKNVGAVSRGGGRPNNRKVQVHSRGGGGFAPFFVRPFVRRGGQTFVTFVCAQPPQSFLRVAFAPPPPRLILLQTDAWEMIRHPPQVADLSF